MYVIAVHSISDPEDFWTAARQANDLPEGIALPGVFPSPDGRKAICVWEADSADTIRNLVEGMVGQFSTNEYFEVDAQNARGLPASISAQA